MHPILLTNHLNPGGAERVLLNLANQWHAAGHDVRVISLYGGSIREQFAPGVEVDIWNCRNRSAFFKLWRLFKSLEAGTPILVFDTGLAVVVGMLRRLGMAGGPLLYREPNAARSNATLRSKLSYRCFISAFDGYIAQTQATADDLRAMTRTCHSIELIQNPCLFITERPEVRFHLPAPDPIALKCLAVGHLRPQKGYDRLIPAFGEVLKRFPGSTLTIAGNGPERANLERWIAASPAASQIRLLGMVRDTAPLYDNADVLILASYFEGLPNVVIEAIALGCPVVVADGRGGTVEFMKTLGLDDFVVGGDFASNLTDALQRVRHSNETLWQSARAKMVDLVHPQRVAERFWDLVIRHAR